MKTGIVILMLSQGLAGCSGSHYLSLTAPSPPSVPSPSPLQPTRLAGVLTGERWSLTVTLTSITGPDACIGQGRANIGKPHDWLLAIQRAGDAIYLGYDASNPNNYDEYVGTAAGDELSATTGVGHGAILCDGMRFDFADESRMSGRFSGDGRVLTAEEVYSFKFTSGEDLLYRYEWSATRQ